MKDYPNYKKAIRVGLIVAGICFIVFVLFFYWVSLGPVMSEVSLSLAFRPIWRTIYLAIFPSIVCGFIIGIVAAYRP